MSAETPPDYADILRKHFASITRKGKSLYRMSARNRRKLERIRERIQEMKSQ